MGAPVVTSGRSARTHAVGIVVPIHNEEDGLIRALGAIDVAITRLPRGIEHRVMLVLDQCRDRSAQIAQEWAGDRSALLEHQSLGNVGAARQLGCNRLLATWPHLHRDRIWLATTDADSTVPSGWLEAQVAEHETGASLWLGRVEVRDWTPRHASTAARWSEIYDKEEAPVHGASMGINAQLYLDVGGFPPLATGEDRFIHRQALAQGARVKYDLDHRVITSARRTARAPAGFAHALTSIEVNLSARPPIGT
jgi:glycosyltransferase involved in cell wall biosynthesis